MAAASSPIIRDWAKDLRKKFDNSPNCVSAQARKVDTILSQTDDLSRIPESVLLAAQQFSASPYVSHPLFLVQAVRTGMSVGRVIPTAVDLASGQILKETWIDKVMKIIMAVARFLSPISWLHKMKAIDLGSHAKWVNATIMSAFTALGIISLIKSIRNYTSMKDRLGLKKTEHGVVKYTNEPAMKAAMKAEFPGWSDEKINDFYDKELAHHGTGDIISDSLELLCAPWENGIVLSNNFGFVIAGATLNFVSSTYKLIRL